MKTAFGDEARKSKVLENADHPPSPLPISLLSRLATARYNVAEENAVR
jgi:hypothetical protein